MMYPTIVTVVAIVITVFLLVRVIPTFKEIYSGFGAKLPTPTPKTRAARSKFVWASSTRRMSVA